MSTSLRKRLARELSGTWTPEVAARTKRRIDTRIVERGRQRRKLARAAVAFAMVSAGGLVYAWVGGRIGSEKRTASLSTAAHRPPPAAPEPSVPPAPTRPGSVAEPSPGAFVAPAPLETSAPPSHPSTRRRPRLVAEPTAERAVSANRPEDPIEERFAQADRARNAGHPAEAVRPLTEIFERHASDPRAAIAAFQLGRVLADELGDPARAAQAFERALSLAPGGTLAADARRRAEEAHRAAATTRGAGEREPKP